MKKTLRKNDKLRFKSEFEHIRHNGTKFVGGKFLLVAAPAPDGLRKCGVICSRKYSKLAVVRNRARRLLFESFRILKPRIAAKHYLMIPRYAMDGCNQQQVQQELEMLLKKAGALAAESPPQD